MENKKIPGMLRRYFWDCNFEDLTMAQYPIYIMFAALNFGTFGDSQRRPVHFAWAFPAHICQKMSHYLTNNDLKGKTLYFWKRHVPELHGPFSVYCSVYVEFFQHWCFCQYDGIIFARLCCKPWGAYLFKLYVVQVSFCNSLKKRGVCWWLNTWKEVLPCLSWWLLLP